MVRFYFWYDEGMETNPQPQPQPGRPNYTQEQLEKLQNTFNDHGTIQKAVLAEFGKLLPTNADEAGTRDFRKNVMSVWINNDLSNQSNAADAFATHFNQFYEDKKDTMIFDISTPEKIRELIKEISHYKRPDMLH